MATVEKSPTRQMSDLDYAIHLMMTGQEDAEFQARIEAEADRITEGIRQRHGVLNIAVELIREVRDEE